MDVVAFPTRCQDAQVGETLKLIRHGLGLHPDRGGEVGHAKLVGPDQGVKKTEGASFASTLNTAASPPAWIGDSSGRFFKSGLVQQPASAIFAVFVLAPSSTSSITLYRVILDVKGRLVGARDGCGEP